MNRFLKPLLILLGLALIGFALFTKLNLRSTESVWENNLMVAANRSEGELIRELRHIVDNIGTGWNVVIYAGGAVMIVACFIKSEPRDGRP